MQYIFYKSMFYKSSPVQLSSVQPMFHKSNPVQSISPYTNPVQPIQFNPFQILQIQSSPVQSSPVNVLQIQTSSIHSTLQIQSSPVSSICPWFTTYR